MVLSPTGCFWSLFGFLSTGVPLFWGVCGGSGEVSFVKLKEEKGPSLLLRNYLKFEFLKGSIAIWKL
jgi:hypothetical protein